jgi:hypothetical protein
MSAMCRIADDVGIQQPGGGFPSQRRLTPAPLRPSVPLQVDPHWCLEETFAEGAPLSALFYRG